MSNYYEPCFYRIDFHVIPSYIELPGSKQEALRKVSKLNNFEVSTIWKKQITTATQPAITYSELTIETLERGVKYVQSYQLRNQNDAGVVLVSLLLTLNIFHILF